AIELRSTLRDEIPALVADLHRRGITTYIISGDHEAPTRTLAQTIGVDHYYAETLPADKARIVDELQAQGQSVCFVGDGINDSIALRKAHVSISLRGATTIATDAAQIVMMDESLAKLPLLFDLSKEFETLMKVNYGIALFPSIVMVSGVFLHFISITGAILFGMSWFYLGLLVPFVPQLQYRVRPRLSLHNPSSDPHTITTETRIETRGDPTNVPDPQTR
ncbi:MAG: HAD-IC family P-type ATPase, partial [Caldilineaceae bacterium]|nr:HAD-IC family P-type ATPase [Caldilineaceae bacterium]